MPEFAVSFCKVKAIFKDFWNTNYKYLDALMSIVMHFLRVTASE